MSKSPATGRRRRSASSAQQSVERSEGRKSRGEKKADEKPRSSSAVQKPADKPKKKRKAAPPAARKRRRGPTPPGTNDAELTKQVATPRAFVVRKSSIAGRGAFARRALGKGVRIAEYTGVRITPDEADDLYPFPEDGTPHHTFLFNVDDNTVIDGSREGDPSRFINHSCDPNCETVIEEDRVFIDTIRKIKADEELVYDYQFVLEEPHNKANKKLYPCYCGARKCRGTILADKRKFKG